MKRKSGHPAARLRDVEAIGANPIVANPLAVRSDYPRRAALQRDLTRYYEEAIAEPSAREFKGERRKQYAAGVAWKRVHLAHRHDDYFKGATNMAAKRKTPPRGPDGKFLKKGARGGGGAPRAPRAKAAGGGGGGGRGRGRTRARPTHHKDVMVIAMNPWDAQQAGKHPRAKSGEFIVRPNPTPARGSDGRFLPSGGGHSRAHSRDRLSHGTDESHTFLIMRNPHSIAGVVVGCVLLGGAGFVLTSFVDRALATMGKNGAPALTGDAAAIAIAQTSWTRLAAEGGITIAGFVGGMLFKPGLGRTLTLSFAVGAGVKFGADLFGKVVIPWALGKDSTFGQRYFPEEMAAYATWRAAANAPTSGQTPGVPGQMAGAPASGAVGCGCGCTDGTCACTDRKSKRLRAKLDELRNNAYCGVGCPPPQRQAPTPELPPGVRVGTGTSSLTPGGGNGSMTPGGGNGSMTPTNGSSMVGRPALTSSQATAGQPSDMSTLVRIQAQAKRFSYAA